MGKGILRLIVLSLFIAVSIAYYISKPTQNQRARVGYTNIVMSLLADAVRNSIDNKKLPPQGMEVYYGNVPRDIQTNAERMTRADVTRPPIVDPNRNVLEFSGEHKGRTFYNSPRNPEGKLRMTGFPIRYFKSDISKLAVLLSNGPDEDVDLTLLHLEAQEATETILLQFSYDPTNGIKSSGDVVYIIQ